MRLCGFWGSPGRLELCGVCPHFRNGSLEMEAGLVDKELVFPYKNSEYIILISESIFKD